MENLHLKLLILLIFLQKILHSGKLKMFPFYFTQLMEIKESPSVGPIFSVDFDFSNFYL